MLNSASINNDNVLNNHANGDQIEWPTFYSAIENMSFDERRMQKQQQRSQQIPSSISVENYNNQYEQQPRSTSARYYENNSLKSQGHGRSSAHQQNTTSNNFYRQTSVTPRILNSSYNEDHHSIQSPSTYFGSGSNVGRGRPITGDR